MSTCKSVATDNYLPRVSTFKEALIHMHIAPLNDTTLVRTENCTFLYKNVTPRTTLPVSH